MKIKDDGNNTFFLLKDPIFSTSCGICVLLIFIFIIRLFATIKLTPERAMICMFLLMFLGVFLTIRARPYRTWKEFFTWGLSHKVIKVRDKIKS